MSLLVKSFPVFAPLGFISSIYFLCITNQSLERSQGTSSFSQGLCNIKMTQYQFGFPAKVGNVPDWVKVGIELTGSPPDPNFCHPEP